MESYYLMPIWHQPTHVHARAHPFKATAQAEVSGKSWSRAFREGITQPARLAFKAQQHKVTRNGI